MAVNIKAMSPVQLKELNSGDKITILYAASQAEKEAGADRIIREQFPKRIATAFSLRWAEEFPSINKISVGQLSAPKRTSTTIVGGSRETVQLILDWMIECCNGKGRGIKTEFPMGVTYENKTRRFHRCHVVRETAELMGITILSEDMTTRMQKMTAYSAHHGNQLHSEDVRAMYKSLPEGHQLLKFVANHIAERIWKRELRAWGAFKTLREEIPAFDQDINELLDPLVEERQARREEAWRAWQERKEKRERYLKRQEWMARRGGRAPGQYSGVGGIGGGAAVRRSYQAYQGGSRTQNSPAAGAGTATASNSANAKVNGNGNGKIRCEVQRKPQRGRPAYAKLPLAEIGVTRENFVGLGSGHGVGRGRADVQKSTSKTDSPAAAAAAATAAATAAVATENSSAKSDAKAVEADRISGVKKTQSAATPKASVETAKTSVPATMPVRSRKAVEAPAAASAPAPARSAVPAAVVPPVVVGEGTDKGTKK